AAARYASATPPASLRRARLALARQPDEPLRPASRARPPHRAGVRVRPRDIGTACAPPAKRKPQHSTPQVSAITSRNIDEDQVAGSGADPALLFLGIGQHTLACGARHQGVEHAIAVHVTAQPALD